MTESSVIIPMAKIKLKSTKIFIESPNMYKPRKDAIRLTGSAIAGTITALNYLEIDKLLKLLKQKLLTKFYTPLR